MSKVSILSAKILRSDGSKSKNYIVSRSPNESPDGDCDILNIQIGERLVKIDENEVDDVYKNI